MIALISAPAFLAGCQGGIIPAPSGTAGLAPNEADLLTEAPVATRSAGCGEVMTTPEYPGGVDRSHIGGAGLTTPPPLATYPTVPPASGPHQPVPLPAGVYPDPPDAFRAIHSLEHSAVVIWYAPDATEDLAMAADLARIQAFFALPTESDHVIVAPYDYPAQGAAGHLPQGITMAMVGWHRLQVCQKVSLSVAFAFVDAYRFDPDAPGRYQGDAPEPGVPIG